MYANASKMPSAYLYMLPIIHGQYTNRQTDMPDKMKMVNKPGDYKNL